MQDEPTLALAHAAMTQPPSLQVRAIALRATLQSCRQMLDTAANIKTLRMGLSDALFQLEIIEREFQKNA